jgi:hypothetical protein
VKSTDKDLDPQIILKHAPSSVTQNNLQIEWYRIFHGKVGSYSGDKGISYFRETRRFIIVFRKGLHLIFSWVSIIQLPPPHPVSLMFQLNII